MSQFEKALDKLLRGRSDQNFGFEDLCHILRRLGFDERVRGSHHIFTRYNVVEILNLQPKGSKAKAYQVKQVREILLRYGLVPTND
ncbi:MAG: type II toxin-antitoxin system HicA family toxin [Caldilineaceae bacterium]|nr:type II toxin-antitoxin system HicA family toxin [Caldilineaceae bacterium]